MESVRKALRSAACLALAGGLIFSPAPAQNAPQPKPAPQPTMLDRINQMLAGGNNAWTPEQIATMEKLRDAALADPWALAELRHLTDNIGPRLSGSSQAQ
ncbi:MAG: hypothetical protein WCE75_09450, partial [Terracidiphilus sp.]